MENPLLAGADDPGLRLIETMYWDGQAVRHWSLHQARLQAGAHALGWQSPTIGAISQHAPDHPARLRLTLAASGEIAFEAGALPPEAELWQVGLAEARLNSADPWLRIKSTRRAVYDTARAALPAHLDEVIFRNKRDEVCDGTITTVFFDAGEGMRTPPLSSGLLPGVLRAALACPEQVLHARDLPHVRLWVGNALRGLIPARFVA